MPLHLQILRSHDSCQLSISRWNEKSGRTHLNECQQFDHSRYSPLATRNHINTICGRLLVSA